mgnify:CR=1 FL=1
MRSLARTKRFYLGIKAVNMSWLTLLNDLENGTVRAATQDEQGHWHANVEVKQGILEAFRNGVNTEFPGGFVDKDNLAPRGFAAHHVRGDVAPRGAYAAAQHLRRAR